MLSSSSHVQTGFVDLNQTCIQFTTKRPVVMIELAVPFGAPQYGLDPAMSSARAKGLVM